MGDVCYSAWICPECHKKAESGEAITLYLDKKSYYFKCEHLVVKR